MARETRGKRGSTGRSRGDAQVPAMPKKLLPLLALATTPCLLRAQDPAATAKAIEELRQRVTELEDQQAKTAERLGGRAVAQSYTAQSLDFGGHLTSLFTCMDGENGTKVGHVVSLMELFLSAKANDQWSLFATPGFYTFNGSLLDDPTTTAAGDPTFVTANTSEADTFLSRLYGQWKDSDALQVQGGIVGSPHGTTNREYFIPARTIGQANLHTRVFLANQLYPQQLAGLRASGKISLGDGPDLFEYDAYFGSEDDSPDDGIGGARAAYVLGDLGLGVALNYGRGTREQPSPQEILTNAPVLQSPFPPRFNGGRDYEFVGIDVDWRRSEFLSRTEAYISAEGPYADQRAFSTEFTWFAAPQWGLTYRFDYYDSGSDQAVVSLTPFTTMEMPRGHATEHVVGICFDPDPSVRLRLDVHHSLLPGSDATVDYVNLSWSISF